MRCLSRLLLLFVAFFGQASEAGLLTTFEGALAPNAPAAGWAYLYNPGPIGDSAGYVPLQATSDAELFYDNDGLPGIPGAAPGGWVYFGLVRSGLGMSDEGTPGGHPGLGSTQDSQNGLAHYAIAAYTLGQGGTVWLSDTRLRNAASSHDGLDLRVYVNDLLKFSGQTGQGQGQTLGFDASLGWLQAGATIYVAVGGLANDFSDSFSLRYSINAVPEPSALALIVLFGWLVPASSRKARLSLQTVKRGLRR